VVAVEVHHDVHAIDLFVEIPLHALLGARHRGRLDCAERDREAFGRGEDPDLGRQRGRLAVQRLDFAEVGDVPGVGPLLRIDAAIDRNRRRRSHVGHEQARCQPKGSALDHCSFSCDLPLWMLRGRHRLQ